MKILNRERCEVCNHYCMGDTGYWCDATGEWVDDPTRCSLFDGDTIEVKRLKAELSQISDKIDGLRAYSSDPRNFSQLSDKEWNLVREQKELLCKYRFVLRQRLNLAKSEDIRELRRLDALERGKEALFYGGYTHARKEAEEFEKTDQADHDPDGRPEVP